MCRWWRKTLCTLKLHSRGLVLQQQRHASSFFSFWQRTVMTTEITSQENNNWSFFSVCESDEFCSFSGEDSLKGIHCHKYVVQSIHIYTLSQFFLSSVFLFYVKECTKKDKHTHPHPHIPLRRHRRPRPHLPLPDSWLLNKDAGNIIKSFTFDTLPAL